MSSVTNMARALHPERERRASVVASARGWLGTPYQHQASLRGVGADCLGLLRGVWREVVGEEPQSIAPYGPGWAELTGGERLLEAALRHLVPREASAGIEPGVVILFRWRAGFPAKHCAIASASTRFIHAQDGASVAEIAMHPQWQRRIAGLFDFPARTQP